MPRKSPPRSGGTLHITATPLLHFRLDRYKTRFAMHDVPFARRLRAPLIAGATVALMGVFLLWDRTVPRRHPSYGQSQATPVPSTDPRRVAPPVSTPPEVVERMLALARVTSKDVVYDLGCGDGRIVIAAAKKYRARGVGIDIDERQITQARNNARQAGVEKLVSFKIDNALTTDFSAATVVTLFLGSAANQRLRPRLEKYLKAGARVVSFTFRIGDWRPTRVERFEDREGVTRTLYLWEIPASGLPNEAHTLTPQN